MLAVESNKNKQNVIILIGVKNFYGFNYVINHGNMDLHQYLYQDSLFYFVLPSYYFNSTQKRSIKYSILNCHISNKYECGRNNYYHEKENGHR